MRRLLVVLGLVLTGALAPAARAAPPAQCPTVMPIQEVRDASVGAGFHATGWTVARENTIEPFDVTVLGVLDDGVAPGVDMIIVDTESAALDDAGGIWAGMSGSPVYADDGKLIGAVAYGLAFGPSKLGGLAAAGDMVNVLNRPVTVSASTVKVSNAIQKKMVATGEVSARQAASGMERLRIPLAVSGVGTRRLQAFADRLPGSERFIPYAAGAGAPTPGVVADIVPGGNFAAALSYGDITAGGVGTTTIVCDGKVVAFGHPMNFDGRSALSAHNATAITIQDDPTLFPFKLANIGGVVGTLDQDRLSGIRAVFDAGPTPIPVHSSVNGGDEHVTYVNRTNDASFLAAGHLLANLDRAADRIGSGTATLNWTLTGTANGEDFSLSRNNKFADQFDVSLFTADDLFFTLDTLIFNPFSDLTFTDVKITSTIDDVFRAYRITGLERRVGTDWDEVDPDQPLQVTPGETLRVRVLLAQDRSTAAVPPVQFSFRVPADAGGRDGSLDVTGGPGGGGGEEGGVPVAEDGGEPQSFDELVDMIRQTPRNDDVVASLQFFSESEASGPAPVRKRAAEVVTGALSVPVTVEGGDEPPPCEEPPCEEPPPPSGPTLALGGKSAFKLATALRRGLKLTLRSSDAGRATVRALVDRRTARRLKLKKHAKGPVLVAGATKRVHAGRNTVKLVFTKKARKRLRHAKRVKLFIRATIRSVEGDTASDRLKLTLKRRLRTATVRG